MLFCYLPQDTAAIARVKMFGGEFCGSATRSVVRLITAGQDCTGLIEVSGTSCPLEFIARGDDIRIEMPLPQTGDLVEKVEDGVLVHLEGITHLVGHRHLHL